MWSCDPTLSLKLHSTETSYRGSEWQKQRLRLYIQNDFEADKKLHNVALKKEKKYRKNYKYVHCFVSFILHH